MGENNFNRKQCVHSLEKIGFCLGNKRRGRHDKYNAPQKYLNNLPLIACPFVMVPRHNELKLQEKIIKEIRLIGGQELVENFLRNL